MQAAQQAGPDASRDAIAAALPAPDVDLLIRTGGEQRLSDFLLWECAYAELVFLPVMWPDFQATHLEQAVHHFESRDAVSAQLRPHDINTISMNRRQFLAAYRGRTRVARR